MSNRSILLLTLLSALALSACMDPIEECVEKKQQAYRQENPKADYAKGSTANGKFRLECQASGRR